jgi:DNA-binding IclR family transcriptional regulator
MSGRSSTRRDQAGLDGYLVRLQEVGERGYAVNHAETSLDEVSVAAPVPDHRGQQVAALPERDAFMPSRHLRQPRFSRG